MSNKYKVILAISKYSSEVPERHIGARWEGKTCYGEAVVLHSDHDIHRVLDELKPTAKDVHEMFSCGPAKGIVVWEGELVSYEGKDVPRGRVRPLNQDDWLCVKNVSPVLRYDAILAEDEVQFKVAVDLARGVPESYRVDRGNDVAGKINVQTGPDSCITYVWGPQTEYCVKYVYVKRDKYVASAKPAELRDSVKEAWEDSRRDA